MFKRIQFFYIQFIIYNFEIKYYKIMFSTTMLYLRKSRPETVRKLNVQQ